jgi:hypothetical protein
VRGHEADLLPKTTPLVVYLRVRRQFKLAKQSTNVVVRMRLRAAAWNDAALPGALPG